MNRLRWLLWPLSLLYAAIIWIRNRAYDFGWLSSKSYTFPIIVVGNLAVGGTGKSPMTEYLIRLLQQHIQVAMLSRGYGRQTKGFRWVNSNDLASAVGDEPLQIKTKFPHIPVAVCEDRCIGVDHLAPHCQSIILDDAFQHRKLKPSFSILLFDYQSLLQPILPLPAGNFRDLMGESRRADSIVVTKSPATATDAEKAAIIKTLKRYTAAPIFFAEISYQQAVDQQQHIVDEHTLQGSDILLLTGIANPKPFVAYMSAKARSLVHMSYADHHQFSQADFAAITSRFHQLDSPSKFIVTTEKDYQRIPDNLKKQYPFVYVPIAHQFLNDQEHAFNTLVLNHIAQITTT